MSAIYTNDIKPYLVVGTGVAAGHYFLSPMVDNLLAPYIGGYIDGGARFAIYAGIWSGVASYAATQFNLTSYLPM